MAVIAVVLACIFHETIGEWVICLFKDESKSAIARNIVLIIATVVALPLALWRLVVADRQSKTARLSLLNERFRQGAEMLVGSQLVERLGGITILEQLAKESVEAHHIQIVELFSMLIRNPPEYKEEDVDTRYEKSVSESPLNQVPVLRADLQSIIWALENRSNEGKVIEKQQKFTLDFSGAKLAHAEFSESEWSSTRLEFADLSNAMILRCVMKGALFPGACLAGAKLIESKLPEAQLFHVDLRKVELNVVDLSEANLDNCNLHCALLYAVDLTGASLHNANLSGAEIVNVNFLDADLTCTDFSDAKLTNVKNLTKFQLSQSVGTPANLPDFTD